MVVCEPVDRQLDAVDVDLAQSVLASTVVLVL